MRCISAKGPKSNTAKRSRERREAQVQTGCTYQTLLMQFAFCNLFWTNPLKGAIPTPAPINTMGPSDSNSFANGFDINPLNIGTLSSLIVLRSPVSWASRNFLAVLSKKPEPTPCLFPSLQFSGASWTVTAISMVRRAFFPFLVS